MHYCYDGSPIKVQASLYNGTGYNRVSLIAAYSHAFFMAECPDFIGIGGKYTTQNCELGIFSDMARFEEATEFATEITGKYQFTPYIYAQPSVHTIFTGHSFRTIVTLRFGMLFP